MDENIAQLMAQVSRLMRRDFDLKARTIGVTRSQWQVLVLVGQHDGINQSGLADMLKVEPITLGRMIDRLQSAGLVERHINPTDRRAWHLHLSEKAIGLLAQFRPMADEMLQIAQANLSNEQRDQLFVVLRQMRANLSDRLSDG